MAVEIQTTATTRSRWERVDQLRGLAALAVVVCHLAVSAYRQAPNLDGGPWPWLGMALGFGYLGVPLFFVISGFCIHLPHARALARATPATAAPDWRRFFRRRFWRLYPPYLAALVVAVALWWAAGSEIPWLVVTTQALLVHPFHTTTFDGVNPPAWTLAVEAQLYLAYPVVFWLIARLGALRALGAVLGVTMAYRVALALAPSLPVELAGPAWEVFLARWFEWVLGAVVAEWAAGRLALPRVLSSLWPATATLGAAVLLEWYAWYYGLYVLKEPLYGVAFALLLYAALARERPGGGSSAPGRYLAGVGAYSYSLYLLHRPIQLAFEPLAREVATWPGVIAHGVPSSLLIMAATTPLVLWAARVFYRCCEAPSIRRSQTI
jgi:peptidoglycan/LPS O-acetylase OafA/YrhL